MKHFSSYFIFRPLAPSDMARDWHLPSCPDLYKNPHRRMDYADYFVSFANGVWLKDVGCMKSDVKLHLKTVGSSIYYGVAPFFMGTELDSR